MTTYSGVIGKNELVSVGIRNRSFYNLNFVLLISLIFMIFSYVFLANFVVAQKYSLNLQKNQLNALNAKIGSVNNTIQLDEDIKTLLLFAQKSGMVEAKDIDSVLQEHDFALSR